MAIRTSGLVRKKAKDWSRARLYFVACVFLLSLAVLWGRAFYLQVVKGPELSLLAQRQYWAKEWKSGKRGEIFDRNGILLAKSVQVKSVYARPVEVEDIKKTAVVLADILGEDVRDIYAKLQKKKNFIWIDRKIGDRKSRRIQKTALPGIYLLAEHERVYPQGHLAGQLLGFVGVDNEGLEGLERSYNEYLKGQKVTYSVQKDAAGKHLYGEEPNAISGKDLHLTLDARIQFAAEHALADAVQSHNATYGMCLVVEVKNGEILAWANYPYFNPNSYQGLHPRRWRNRIALDSVEVGSTMKPFLVAAALEEKVCSPKSIYFCENGKWEQPGFSIVDTHEYDWLSVSRIVSYSSNIGAAKLGMALGANRYHTYLHKFGFGRGSDIKLPGEGKGIMRPPHKWHPVDLATASFGQGVGVTALQLARGYLILARDGRFCELKIVKEPKKSEHGPGEAVVSPEVARSIRGMLAEVVAEGTGKNGNIDGLKVGGKTGTAQKAEPSGGYGEDHVASFVAMLPVEDPEYLALVIVDEPRDGHFGGVVAAPAVKNALLQTLSYRGQLPEAVNMEPVQVILPAKTHIPVSPKGVRAEQKKSRTIPDVRGMDVRRAVELLAVKGIVPTLEGTGVVVQKQDPAPGSPRPDGKDVDFKIWLTDVLGQS